MGTRSTVFIMADLKLSGTDAVSHFSQRHVTSQEYTICTKYHVLKNGDKIYEMS